VLEEAVHHRDDLDRVARALEPRPQAADPAHREANPHPCPRRVVEGANDLLVHERVHLRADLGGLARLGALAANWRYFLDYVGFVVFAVFLHNALALLTGYWAARFAGLPERDRRAVSIEVGIQNSGLGLILIFNFFDGLGGMAIVTAWWGVWHLISGLAVGTFWSRRAPVLQKATDRPEATDGQHQREREEHASRNRQPWAPLHRGELSTTTNAAQ